MRMGFRAACYWLCIFLCYCGAVAVSLDTCNDDRTPVDIAILTLSNGLVLEIPPDQKASAVAAVELYSQAQQAVASGEQERGIQLYRQSIQVFPQLASTYNNLGMLIYEHSKNPNEAMRALEQGLLAAQETNDTNNFVSIHNNMGYILREQDKRSVAHALEAIKHFNLALEVDPGCVSAMYNKASALNTMHYDSEAEKLYQQVLQLEPHHEGAHLDMGKIFFARGNIKQAVKHQDAVINTATTQVSLLGAMNNKGQFLKDGGFLLRALRVHSEALDIAPDNPLALANVITAKRTLCQWEKIEGLHDRLYDTVENELRTRAFGTSLLPYDSTLLRLSDAVRKQLAVAHARMYEQTNTLALGLSQYLEHPPSFDRQSGRALKIGYLSFDFREHPMGHLTLGLIEHHNASQVQTFCYSYGENDKSEWRTRIEHGCYSFQDVAAASDLEAAQLIGRDGIDIVVDLMAHTKGARLGITALKPSAIIVNYLGYPGTVGSSFTDFMMVDRFVVPPEIAASTMTEQVVYLPHTYQANLYDPSIIVCASLKRHSDRRNYNATAIDTNECEYLSRAKYGLPTNNIVFCNFNTINKMEPVSFNVWMRILHRVPHSVLWLLKPDGVDSDAIIATLLEEAKAHGVLPSRVIFASRMDKRSHLARVTFADVFLDSFTYNAHSTASDAMWANVPIVTFWGDTFPSRVAAGLIHNAVRVPEIVPHSIKAYEDMAVQLAQNPTLRGKIRYELASLALISPLFDTKRITENIESAYEVIHDVIHRLSSDHSKKQRFQLMVNPVDATVFSNPSNVELRLQAVLSYANAWHERGQLRPARNAYGRILQIDPKYQPAVGYFDLLRNNFDRILKENLRTVEEGPNIRSKDLSQSAAVPDTAEDALHLDASDLSTFKNLLKLYSEHKSFDKLADLFTNFGEVYFDTSDQITDDEREQRFLYYSYVLVQTGRLHDAIHVLDQVVEKYPNFFRVRYNIAAVLSIMKMYQQADDYQIATALTESRYRLQNEGTRFPKTVRPPHKVVLAIYCYDYDQSWWGEWGPSSLNIGLGGSEEAVVFMARELQRLGYWVEVYGNPPKQDLSNDTKTGDNDVLWYPHYTYDTNDAGVDIFIAWRYHISLVLGTNARLRYFWIHDTPSEDTKQSRFLASENVDGIFCVSQFQASLFPETLQPKIVVMSNGLDLNYFANGLNRNTHFVYGSSPNRGLMHLLRAWPEIQQRIPGATLSIYYGFTPGFMFWAKEHMRNFSDWKVEMDQMIRTLPGVKYHGLVNHYELAVGYADAGFYLYPTTFSETSCVSLMKAMANGAIPITSRYPKSAISETCGEFDMGPRAVNGNSTDIDREWTDLWIQAIVDAANQGTEIRTFRKRMKAFARKKYRWTRIAIEWHRVISNPKTRHIVSSARLNH